MHALVVNGFHAIKVALGSNDASEAKIYKLQLCVGVDVLDVDSH